MYESSRSTRLIGERQECLDWGISVAKRSNSLTGRDTQVWSAFMSPDANRLTWSAWFETLQDLETATDKLQADTDFIRLTDRAVNLTDGTVHDSVIRTISADPIVSPSAQYRASTFTVMSPGHYAEALSLGAEIAAQAERYTDLPTLFVESLAGPFGQVGFVSYYDSMARFEEAQDVLRATPEWSKLLDSTEGLFVENPRETQTIIERRIA